MAGLLDGVLPAIYSAGNTAKRRLNGLLADPAGTLGLGLNRFAEDNNNTLNLMANAYPMAGDKTVLNSPKQNALARALLADKGTDMAMAGMIGPAHDDILKSISKGGYDDAAAQAFGRDGFIYHTPYRPFENSQATAIGGGTPISERVFSTQKPLTAAQLKSIEALPISDDATNAFAKELSDEGAIGFMNKDNKRFSVVTPSAKNQGQFQATQYDPRGAIGDSQHQTSAEAIRRLIDAGYSKTLDENRVGGLLSRVMLGQK